MKNRFFIDIKTGKNQSEKCMMVNREIYPHFNNTYPSHFPQPPHELSFAVMMAAETQQQRNAVLFPL